MIQNTESVKSRTFGSNALFVSTDSRLKSVNPFLGKNISVSGR